MWLKNIGLGTDMVKTELSLRELLVEYIFFALDEDMLMAEYSMTPQEVEDLSDVDLLELYDHCILLREV